LCCVSFVIRTSVSIKKEFKKIEKKIKLEKRKVKKQKRKRRGKGLYCGLVTENFSLHIQILGDLYTSNVISFEHIKPLDFQYRSLPCSATYSSTKKLKPGHSTRNPCDLRITSVELLH